MIGLDASFGARAIKALKPAVTGCLYQETLYPDRIQDTITWRFEAGERLTFTCKSGSLLRSLDLFGVYRPQAEFSGGRFDGKFGVASAEIQLR